MDVTLVQDSEDDVDGDERGKNQQWFVRERTQEGRGGALKGRLNAGRHADVFARLFDGASGITERRIRRKVEGDGNGWKLALMIDGESGPTRLKSCESAERDLLPIGGTHVDVFQGVGVLAEVRFH